MSEQILEQIKEQGELVRKLKAAKESPEKVSYLHHETECSYKEYS